MLRSHLVKSDNSVRGREDLDLGTFSSLGQIDTLGTFNLRGSCSKKFCRYSAGACFGSSWTGWSAGGVSALVLFNHTWLLIRTAGGVGLSLQFTRTAALLLLHGGKETQVLTMRLLVVSCALLVSSFTLSLACLLFMGISTRIHHHGEGPGFQTCTVPPTVCVLLPVSCPSHTHTLQLLFILLFDFTLPSCHGCFDVFLLLPPTPSSPSSCVVGELCWNPDFSPQWRGHAR